jgi:Mg2+ and Co2+ transporter CorA
MATAGATERMAGRLEKKVADLRNTYDVHQQNKINHRLELLTVLSAIFLPLTFMAGKHVKLYLWCGDSAI